MDLKSLHGYPPQEQQLSACFDEAHLRILHLKAHEALSFAESLHPLHWMSLTFISLPICDESEEASFF